MFEKTLLMAVLGALFCLDRSCLQSMIHRPIVMAPFLGWILGDVKTGLIVGAFLELMWVDRPSMGNYVPPNDSLAAAVITGTVILAGANVGGVSRELTTLGILLLLPLVYGAQRMDMYIMAKNDALAEVALAHAATGNATAIEKNHLSAILKTYLYDLLFIYLATFAAVPVVGFVYDLLPMPALKTLELLYFTFPLLIAGIVLNTIKLRGDVFVFSSLFIILILLAELLHGI